MQYMSQTHFERISVVVIVVLVLGIGLLLQTNRENVTANTASAFATAGSVSLCPIKQVVYGLGNAFSAQAARSNAIKACRNAATEIECPAACPKSSATSDPIIIKEEHLAGSDWYHAWAECTRVCNYGISTYDPTIINYED